MFNTLSPLPSTMRHDFSQVPRADIPRSSFNRSHGHKTTFDAGYLIPIFLDEALPGDTFNLGMAGFGRLATPLFPVMDNIYLDTHFFAVPYRLVWDNWQKFNGEQIDPGDSTDFVIPGISLPAGPGYIAEQSLGDYFGLPTKDDFVFGTNTNWASALPFRAYNLIYNEWFRDQNLIDSAVVDRDDGPDDMADYVLRRRGKRHDYFTSCLPFVQKGDAVNLPTANTAAIYTDAVIGDILTIRAGGAAGAIQQIANSGTDKTIVSGVAGSADDQLRVDLTSATAVTINQLREAFQIQRLLERDARGGTRYTEIIRAHFGVVSPDQRLQRPEYLGGGSSRLNITPVPQTSSTDATTPQGNLAAYGTVSFNGHGFTKSFTEHCLIIGLVSVRADLTYQQCINRMWSRKTRYDFYWPALAHLGEQAVLNKEIFAGSSNATDNAVFGYQERYAEYRYKPSLVTGLFRSNATQSLDTWHLAQEFASTPVLNQTFIEENPPIDRVIAVPSQPHIIFDSYFDLKCARPMPLYSVPGLVDHF